MVINQIVELSMDSKVSGKYQIVVFANLNIDYYERKLREQIIEQFIISCILTFLRILFLLFNTFLCTVQFITIKYVSCRYFKKRRKKII